jgi:electron transfer flavoprotein alpha subunit
VSTKRDAGGTSRATARPRATPDSRLVLRVKSLVRPEDLLPNILVYVEIREGRPTDPSLFALSESRRVARLAGASTFAVVATPRLATEQLEALAAPIGDAGVDKLLWCEADDFATPPLDATHGRALDAAVARVPPMLVLFPAGGAGAALGPPLAVRLGGPFAPWCDFVTSESEVPVPDGAGRVQLIHLTPYGRFRRRLDPLDIERPIVATLGAGRMPPPTGRISDLEIEIVPCGDPPEPPIVRELDHARDEHADIQIASVIALLGSGGATKSDLDALATGLPKGTFLARASDVPASVLSACCPDVLLKIGPSAALTARSPRTQVVSVVHAGDEEPTQDEADIVWQVQSPADVTPTAIANLLRAIAEDG